MKRSGF